MLGARAMLAWPFDVVLRPERLVSVDTSGEGRGWSGTLIEATRLMAVYSLNLVLYAAPLTLAGFGVGDGAGLPEFVASLVTNSAFLLAGTLLTLFTFHIGVLISGASSGLIRSFRAVTYSTGIYLALGYTLVWYVATTPRTSTASNLLIALQAEFLYFFIDLLDAGLTLPGGRPEAVNSAGLTPVGEMILVMLGVSALYYLYVLYIGSRTGHGSNRVQALVATAFVLVSPAMYAVGTILYSLLT